MRYIGILIFLSGLTSAAHADRPQEPFGQWLTQDGEGVITIEPCGAGICGRITGMDSPSDSLGRPVTDPQGKPQCGLTILRETQEAQPGLWQGTITNPNDGTNWRCEFWMVGETIHLRGYILFPLLGKTQVWTRYAGSVRPDCGMVKLNLSSSPT